MGASGGAPAGASGGAPRALRGFFGASHGERRARGGGGRKEAERPEAVGQGWPARGTWRARAPCSRSRVWITQTRMFSTCSEPCPCACSTRTCKHMASAHVRKRISTEEAAAGTRKGRRKGGAHRARERAQMPEMRENRTGTHQVSFRARAQQSTMHATRRSANLGFEAGRRGGKEDGSCEEPQPSRRRQAEHSHAHALAACGARGGGCRSEGGAAPGSTHLFFSG